MPPVPQHHLLDVPYAEAIDEYESGADPCAPLDRRRIELHRLAVLDHHDAVLAKARLACDLGVLE